MGLQDPDLKNSSYRSIAYTFGARYCNRVLRTIRDQLIKENGLNRKRKSVSGDCPILAIENKTGGDSCDDFRDPESMPYTVDTEEMTEDKSQRKNQDNISHTGDK